MRTAEQKVDIASYVLAGVALLLIMLFHLLSALLAGLLVYELIHFVTPSLKVTGATLRTRKMIVLGLVVAVVALLVSAAVLGISSWLSHGPLSVAELMQKMADLLESSRAGLPESLREYLPTDTAEVERVASGWLRSNAGMFRTAGESLGRVFAHIFIGIVIASLLAFTEATSQRDDKPLARALKARAAALSSVFRRIASSQLRVSALNTVLTGVYLLVALPLFGVHLPLVKTMIVVTFIAGLMPVIGNLISNAVIVIVSLSASLGAAVASLVYLVVIHKFEYVLNAQIVGTRIHARAWELLIAMLAMEALFGLPGVIAAPIFYAYLKDELTARGLI